MRKFLYAVIAVVLAAAVFTGVATATGESDKGADLPAEGGTVAAQAPNARLAVHVNGGSSGFTVLRAKGAISISNPQPGTYCIRPVSTIKVGRAVPTVATDYWGTGGFDTFAQWNSGRPTCAAGRIQVNTFDASAGTPYNDVAFTVVVP
jgi:hypothetical protein